MQTDDRIDLTNTATGILYLADGLERFAEPLNRLEWFLGKLE